MAYWRVGVDSGGTFTDICLFEETEGRVEIWKVSSTPDDPSRGIAQGVEEGMRRASPDAGDRPTEAVSYFGHGTTVATNALIQHRGRWVRSARIEWLDHMFIFNERHLQKVMRRRAGRALPNRTMRAPVVEIADILL